MKDLATQNVLKITRSLLKGRPDFEVYHAAAKMLYERKMFESAREQWLNCLSCLRESLDPLADTQSPEYCTLEIDAMNHIACCLGRLGNTDESQKWFDDSIQMLEQYQIKSVHPLRASLYENKGISLKETDVHEYIKWLKKAFSVHEKALEILDCSNIKQEHLLGPHLSSMASISYSLAFSMNSLSILDEAEKYARMSIFYFNRSSTLQPVLKELLLSQYLLALILSSPNTGKHSEAFSLLEEIMQCPEWESYIPLDKFYELLTFIKSSKRKNFKLSH